jgi:ribose-phosphate pyrophosphokinase
VTGKKASGEKTLMVFTGRAHPELADDIAGELGIAVSPTSIHDFANGEIYARYQESVRGCDAFVVQSMAPPINQWLMETLVMVDALKRGSAKRITVVVPFYPYARQDKKHLGREPISARLIADLYRTAGADRILTVDLHTSQIQGFFDGPVDHLFALPLLADYVADRYPTTDFAVVAPDSGRVRVAERWSQRLGGVPLAFIHKTRDVNVPNSVVANRVVGEVAGRTCLIVDDMIDTAGTITKAAEALYDDGARWSSPTRCRSRTTGGSTRSPCCRSRRWSPRPSRRSSRTARSPRCSTETPDSGPKRSGYTRRRSFLLPCPRAMP